MGEDLWPIEVNPIATCELEVRPIMSHTEVERGLTPDPTMCDRWFTLVRNQAYAIRFFHWAKKNRPKHRGVITSDEMEEARNALYRQAQLEGYSSEMRSLKMDLAKVDKSSSLYKLSPFLDEKGVMRMRGRIDRLPWVGFDTKNPIILPRDHPITMHVVDFYHRKYHHHNQETVVNEVRQKFVITRLRVTLKQIRSRCQKCKVDATVPLPPEMAQLPLARLSPFTRPFSFVGLDYFGPMEVVVGRHKEKRWGVLFTCLTVRGIHLGIAHSLTADACIMCLQNMIARRGIPIEIHSDNGTNFKGADRELRQQLLEIQDELQRHFTQIKWVFIPPASPHMGGSWERMVSSVKTTLREVLPTHRPTDELLRCCLMEAEMVINSRPLTYIPVEPGENEALTPNHFILGTSSNVKPLGIFTDDVLVLRKNWKVAQRMADHFWKRWLREYLPVITRRSKWFEKAAPIQVGSVVIIMDDDRRGSWQRGVVTKTIMSADNQVRRVTIETATGIYERPAVKVAVLDVLGPVSKC